jgi:hypothetical protein
MSKPIEDVDEVANRVVALFATFTSELIRKYGVKPETVAKAAVGTAIMLYLEYNTDNERAAADYLRTLAAEIEESQPPQPIN